MKTPSRRQLIVAATAIAVAAIIYVYGSFDPSTHLFPRCPFLMLTGLQCPGCGSQRAIHALLTGELGQAWHFNALMVASLPFLLLLAVADIMRQRLPSFYARLNSVAVIYTVAVVIVVWWIGRNLL